MPQPVSNWSLTSTLFILTFRKFLFWDLFRFWVVNTTFTPLKCSLPCFTMNSPLTLFSQYKLQTFFFFESVTRLKMKSSATVGRVRCSQFFSFLHFGRICTISLSSIFTASCLKFRNLWLSYPLSVRLIFGFCSSFLKMCEQISALYSKVNLAQKLNI